jgi:hypothetical protein
MTDKEQKARTKAAEEQNQKAQEEARRKIEEENERRLQAQRDAIGAEATTRPSTFQEAAKATEELEQPPSFANARELEQPASVTQPPAKNVNETTLPEEIRAPEEPPPGTAGTTTTP